MTTSKSQRWAQAGLAAAFFFVGFLITIIVINEMALPREEVVRERKVSEASRDQWPQVPVGDYISEQGETLPDFLRRVGRVLHDYTKANGVEACGVIASNGSRYSVKLHTDGVPHGCAMQASDVLDDFTFTGETIHSHPWQKLLTMTTKARAWSRLYKDGHAGAPTLRNDGASGFSKADRASGNGWLVAGGQLLHLSHGRTERLGPIDTN